MVYKEWGMPSTKTIAFRLIGGPKDGHEERAGGKHFHYYMAISNGGTVGRAIQVPSFNPNRRTTEEMMAGKSFYHYEVIARDEGESEVVVSCEYRP